MSLDPKRVETALRRIIGGLDYDLHKDIDRAEDPSEHGYPSIAADFITHYNETSN